MEQSAEPKAEWVPVNSRWHAFVYNLAQRQALEIFTTVCGIPISHELISRVTDQPKKAVCEKCVRTMVLDKLGAARATET